MPWLLLTLALIVWVIVAFPALLKTDKDSAPRWLIRLTKRIDGPIKFAIASLLICGVIVKWGFTYLHPKGIWRDFVGDFYANFAMEWFSIALTILVIDQLYRLRSEQEEKERLILQMGSPDNAFANEAARQLERRTWLRDGSLNGAYLNDANLKGAKLTFADLKGANLNGAKLSGAFLESANLSGASLIFANLSGANLIAGANLSFADLRLANLSGADLSGANLTGAKLIGVNLSGANLTGVNLSGGDLKWAKLNGARYDSATQWPEGFDPKAAGAIKVKWVFINKLGDHVPLPE